MLKHLAVCLALAFPVTACSTFSGTPTTQPSVPGEITNANNLLAAGEKTFVILQKVLRSPAIGLKGAKAAAAFKANAGAKVALDAARSAVKVIEDMKASGQPVGLALISNAGTLIGAATKAVLDLTSAIHGP